MHPWNADWKPDVETAVLYMNIPTGIDVIPVHPKNVALNPVVETAVLYLNRSTGIDVSPVQFWNDDWKFNSPGIVGTMAVAFSLARSAAFSPKRIFPPEAKLPVILGYQRPAVA